MDRKSSTISPTRGYKSDKMKLLVVLGEGGHSAELLNLVDLFSDRYDYHYIVSKKDNLIDRIRHPGPIYKVTRPRGKHTGTLCSIFQTILALIESLWILLRIRPVAMIGSGPAIFVPVSIVGKLLGVRIIFVETGSRVKTLSLTGRIVYRWADLFFVQWPQLKETLPKAIYAGRLC